MPDLGTAAQEFTEATGKLSEHAEELGKALEHKKSTHKEFIEVAKK